MDLKWLTVILCLQKMWPVQVHTVANSEAIQQLKMRGAMNDDRKIPKPSGGKVFTLFDICATAVKLIPCEQLQKRF